MDAENNRSVPPEIKVTVELLLDTERKIEKLRAALTQLGSAGKPALNYTPPGTTGSNEAGSLGNRKNQLLSQIADLTNQTVGITKEIEKVSAPGIKQRVTQLVDEWKLAIQPEEAGSDKELSKAQQRVSRMLNGDWKAVELPTTPQTPFRNNADEMASQKASYMDKARGLQDRYAYLNNESVSTTYVDVSQKHTPEKEDPEIDLE